MFKVSEILKATKGKLICGNKDLIVGGVSSDTRTIRKNEAFIALKGDNFDGRDFIETAVKNGASCIICNQGSAGKAQGSVIFIEVRDTAIALGDLARFNRERFTLPVIAVTGSNGKTTTKDMIARVLSAKFKVLKNEGTKNNHIGLPSALLNLDSSYELAVLEIGANHFGEVGYLADICRPNIGVITNIGPSHLEFLKDLKGVFREKISLLKSLKEPKIAVLNNDDKFFKGKTALKGARPYIFSTGIKNKSHFYASGIIHSQDFKSEFILNGKYRFAIKSPGIYNIYNALLTIAIARIFGMGYIDIARRLSTFKFPQSRLNLIEINKIKFIDDTYNSNPLSLEQALEVLDNIEARGRKILVMGDMMELGERGESFHRKLGRQAAKVCDVFIGVGKLSKAACREALRKGFERKGIFTCASNAQARDVLLEKIIPGPDDIVLVKGSRAMKMEEVFKI